MSIIASLKSALYPWVSRWSARTCSLEFEDASGATGRVLLVHDGLFQGEVRARLLPPDARVVAQGRLFLGPGLAGRLAACRDAHDLVIAVLPPAALAAGAAGAAGGGFIGPQEVRQVIPLDGGWDTMRTHFSAKRRQISNRFEEKHGLSARFSHDPAELEHFRVRMLEPLLRRRHGMLAAIDPPQRLTAWFARGGLLLVEKDGRAVAGALAEEQGDTLLFRRSGVLDADDSLVKAGAQTALYYFLIRHALARGLRHLDTLMSAPFPLDGVFRHKADWGAVSLPDDVTARQVLYLPRQGSAVAARLLDAWPVVVSDGAGRLGVLAGSNEGAAQVPLARGLTFLRALSDPAA